MSSNSDRLYQLIVDNLEIRAVIEDYNINLKKKGRDFVGLCPFHDDKNPSMLISVKKKIFKCFSCGVGGGIIKFVSLITKSSHSKALEKIAKKYFPEEKLNQFSQPTFDPQQQKLLEINKELHAFFKSQLLNPIEKVKNFFKNRKINAVTVYKYELGYASNDKHELFNYLKTKNYETKDILSTNFFNIDEKNNKAYSYLRDRIIFPLKNDEGELIGFSGRTIEDNKIKFLISRENTIFRKSEILFNLSFVLENFLAAKEVFLVEGFFDAIRLTDNNLPAIASLGTELTKQQSKILKERFEKIIIFPDGDEPGLRAALKSASILINSGIQVQIIDHHTKLDPDELLIKDKTFAKNYQKFLTSPLLFLLQNTKEFAGEKLKEFLNIANSLMNQISEIEKYEFFKRLKEKSKIPQSVWEKQFKSIVGQEVKFGINRSEIIKNKILGWEEMTIGIIAGNKLLFEKLIVVDCEFKNPELNLLWNDLRKKNNQSFTSDSAKKLFNYKTQNSINLYQKLTDKRQKKLFQDQIDKMRKIKLKKIKKSLSNRLFDDFLDSETKKKVKTELDWCIKEFKKLSK